MELYGWNLPQFALDQAHKSLNDFLVCPYEKARNFFAFYLLVFFSGEKVEGANLLLWQAGKGLRLNST